MQCSSAGDIEYFDYTEYYDKLQASVRDLHAISQILWNAMLFLGACISLIVVLAVMWAAKPELIMAAVEMDIGVHILEGTA